MKAIKISLMQQSMVQFALLDWRCSGDCHIQKTIVNKEKNRQKIGNDIMGISQNAFSPEKYYDSSNQGLARSQL